MYVPDCRAPLRCGSPRPFVLDSTCLSTPSHWSRTPAARHKRWFWFSFQADGFFQSLFPRPLIPGVDFDPTLPLLGAGGLQRSLISIELLFTPLRYYRMHSFVYANFSLCQNLFSFHAFSLPALVFSPTPFPSFFPPHFPPHFFAEIF